MPDNVAVSFSIILSPAASEQIRRFGAPKELAMQLADSLNDTNESVLNEIRRRLNVQGVGKHHRGSKRGISESSTGNYSYPHKISGRLQRSMGRTDAVIDGFSTSAGGISKVRATIGSGVGTGAESVRYAAAQEYGLEVPSRPSRSKKYRKFSNPADISKTVYKDRRTGKFIGTPMTKAYSVPARSYLNSTISTMKDVWPLKLSRTVLRFYSGS